MFEYFKSARSVNSKNRIDGMMLQIKRKQTTDNRIAEDFIMRLNCDTFGKLNIKLKDRLLLAYCADEDMFAVKKATQEDSEMGLSTYLVSSRDMAENWVTSIKRPPKGLSKILGFNDLGNKKAIFSQVRYDVEGKFLVFQRVK